MRTRAQRGSRRKHIHYLTMHRVFTAACAIPIPTSSRPASVQFHARPCDLCIMVLLFHSVYSELRLYLDNCSHEDSLSSHSAVSTRPFDGLTIPEGRRTPSHVIDSHQVSGFDRELRVTPRSPGTVPSNIVSLADMLSPSDRKTMQLHPNTQQ